MTHAIIIPGLLGPIGWPELFVIVILLGLVLGPLLAVAVTLYLLLKRGSKR